MNIADFKLKSSLMEYYEVMFSNDVYYNYFRLTPFYTGCGGLIERLESFKFLKKEELVEFLKKMLLFEIDEKIKKGGINLEEVHENLSRVNTAFKNYEAISVTNLNTKIVTQNKWFYFYDYDKITFEEDRNCLKLLLPVYMQLIKEITTYEKEVKEEGLPYKPAKQEVKREMIDQFPLVCEEPSYSNGPYYHFSISKDKTVKTYNRVFSFFIKETSMDLYYLGKKDNEETK